MDLASLISALGASDKAAAESNPFSPLQSASEGIGAALLQNAGNFSTSENLIGGLLTGLVSGFTDNIANNYQSKQSGMASQLLNQALSGQSVFEKPDDMNQSIFDVTKRNADLLSLGDSLETKKAADAIAAEKKMKIFEAGLANYEKANRNLTKMAGGGVAVQTPGLDPNSYEALEQKYQGNETLIDAELKRNLESPDRLKSIREEFTKLPEVQVFKLADIGFKSMQKAYDDPAGTSDIELGRAAIQAIEPGLAYRTDDEQAVRASPSLPEELKAQLLGAINGTTRLSPSVRKGLMRIAARRYNEHASNFNIARNFYTKRAEADNLDPLGITPYGAATLRPDLERLGIKADGTLEADDAGQVPPGMKLQRNQRTGETRLVPQ